MAIPVPAPARVGGRGLECLQFGFPLPRRGGEGEGALDIAEVTMIDLVFLNVH
jgi:hypothetical protein